MDDCIPMDTSGYYNTFIGRLNRLKKLEQSIWIVTYLLRLFLIVGPVCAAGLAIEHYLWLPVPYRILVSIVIACVGCGTIVFHVYQIVKAYTGQEKQFSFESISRNVGNTFPEIEDKLLNGMQLFGELSSPKLHTSPALINEAMDRIGHEFGSFNFKKSIDYRKIRSLGKYSVVFSLIAAFPIFFSSDALFQSADRLIHPTIFYPVPASFSFDVFPGSVELIRGKQLQIAVRVDGTDPGDILLHTQQEGKTFTESHTPENSATGRYTFDFPQVNTPFDYYVTGYDDERSLIGRTIVSESFTVSVVHHPMVRMMKVLLERPEYTGIGSNFLEDNIGDIAALKGTQVRIDLTLNKPVTEALIQFNKGSTLPLSVSDSNATGTFAVTQSKRYTVQLKDRDGITNSEPIEYRITALDDAYPFIQLLRPGEDTDLTDDRQVILGLKISDDYGISRLRLGYRIEESGTSQKSAELVKEHNDNNFTYLELPFERRSKAVQDIHFLLDLKQIQLFPEEQITYFADVFDNDAVSGPKHTRSRFFRLRLPSLNELFSQASEIQVEQEEKLEEIVEESRALQNDLTELTREYLKSEKLDWEQQQKTEEAIRKQKEIQKTVEEIKKEIENLTQKFEQNDLLSSQTLDKYKELQELLSELISPELQEMLQSLQKSMEQEGPLKEKQQEISNFRAAQEEFLERVDRTLKLLRKLQAEQMIDEIVTRIETITHTQQAINSELSSLENSESSSSQQLEQNSLAQQESNLAQDTDNLQLAIENVLEKAIEQPDIPADQLGRMFESIERQEISDRMDRMSKAIREDDFATSRESGAGISQDLEAIEDGLRAVQQEMANSMKDKIVSEMRKSASNLLQLSKNQETAKTNSSSLTPNSNNYTIIADEQLNISSGLTRVIKDLVELSEQTFFIPPELGKSISQSMRSMQESIAKLEARDKNGTISQQIQSLQGLNESIDILRSTISQAQNSQTGIGFNEYLERMEQLSGAQGGVNEQTLPLLQRQGYSQNETAALQRLKRDQQLIQKSLEELQREMQGQEGLQSRLKNISSEMQEIINNLENMKITERTVQLQQRIFSRMLDAQRSIHRRDFSNKREAETAQEYDAVDPGILPENLGEGSNILEERLMNALREGYKRDFEELIRNYFEQLNKQE